MLGVDMDWIGAELQNGQFFFAKSEEAAECCQESPGQTGAPTKEAKAANILNISLKWRVWSDTMNIFSLNKQCYSTVEHNNIWTGYVSGQETPDSFRSHAKFSMEELVIWVNVIVQTNK